MSSAAATGTVGGGSDDDNYNDLDDMNVWESNPGSSESDSDAAVDAADEDDEDA